MDPSLIQGVLEADDDYDPELLRAKRMQAQASRLRNSAMSQQGTHAGRVYVAPGIANLAAGVGAQLMANQREQMADTALKGVGDRRRDARSKYMDAMSMALRKQYPQEPGAVLPPDGMEDR